jgi:AbrB family looped-hinge helix DNA binding protein
MYDSMTSWERTMAQSGLSAVQAKGQVTIPSEIRKRLGLKKGDLVAFIETDRGVLISPQEVVAMEALDQIGRLLREKGVTQDELMESGREIREDLLRELYDLSADTKA